MRGTQDGYKVHATRGLGSYMRQLGERLPDHIGNSELLYIYQNNLPLDHRLLNKPVKTLKVSKGLPVPFFNEMVRTQFTLPFELSRVKPDIVHFLFQEDGLMFSPRNTIITVPDLIPFIMSEQYEPNRNLRLRLKNRLAMRIVKKAQKIIAISETTKRDLVNIWGIDENKIAVTYLAVDDNLSPITDNVKLSEAKSTYNLPDDYFLYIGGIDPRKNMPNLIKAFARAITQTNTNYSLVLAGDFSWQVELPALQVLIDSLKISDRILLTGFIKSEHINALYSSAKIFVFPSLYEGFGLPPLEAMKCGVPVIAGHNSSILEVCGDAAYFVDVSSIDDLAKAMVTLANNSELRAKLVGRGLVQASKFTWDNTARQTVRVYEDLLSEAKTPPQK
jgi:glycosyltransferase involved in cell wall biosynthesis